MSIDLMSTSLTITAPAATDGRGAVAVLNDTASGNFVGYLFDASGFDGPPVRTSLSDVPEGPGAIAGSFQHGPRSITLEVDLRPGASWAASNERRDKLYQAFNAMAAVGKIEWTELGVAYSKRVDFLREQPPRGPDKEGKVLLAGVCPDPRIYSGTEYTWGAATSFSGATTLYNGGDVGSPPRFTIASPGATVNITNTTTSQTLTFTGLSGGGTVTVDFKDRSITQGGVRKDGAVSFPSSVWWELIEGNNNVTVTNAATPTWRWAWI